MNLNNNRKPKICPKCTETLQLSYGFKTFILDNNKRVQELKILEETMNGTLEKATRLCCLCVQENIFEDLEEDVKANLKMMVQRCFPQLNLYTSNNLGVCETCLNSLKDLNFFINNCLESEEFVKNYCSTKDMICKDVRKLDECIKHKNLSFIPNDNRGETEEAVFSSTFEDIGTTALENNSDLGNAQELNGHMMRHKDPLTTKMHKCEVCGHETKRIADLRWHMIVHKDPEEVTMYKCADCPYETKRKADLKQHVIIHNSHKFKCDLCSFETKNELYLNTTHMLVHKDKTEVKLFKCESCPYQAKCKQHVKQHSRIHKSRSELSKFKCNWCDFETVYKQGIQLHLLVHKCRSEIRMHKCHLCEYEGTRKSHLKEHMLRHVNPSDVTLECNKCSYKTKKRKDYLRKHMNVHKDPLTTKMYKCEL
ncbi:hypothetical protein NQ314_014634, partial [Rhamnusium bicolor]